MVSVRVILYCMDGKFIGHTQLILNEREKRRRKKLINIMGSWVPFFAERLIIHIVNMPLAAQARASR